MTRYCTVTVVAPDTPFTVAVMVAVPTPCPFTKPLGSTVAMASDDEVQLTVFLRSCMLPSEKVKIAVSCTVVFVPCTEMMGFVGMITIEVRTAEVTVIVVDPETPA